MKLRRKRKDTTFGSAKWKTPVFPTIAPNKTLIVTDPKEMDKFRSEYDGQDYIAIHNLEGSVDENLENDSVSLNLEDGEMEK